MLKVENYKPEHSGAVRNLIVSILKAEYPFDMSAYSETDINDISGVYGGGRNTFFVVKDGERVIATAGIKGDSEKTAILRRLFVDKKYRKKGLGSTLIKTASQFCRKKGYSEIAFRATDRMKAAMHLLEKHGFEKQESLDMGGFHIHKLLLKL